jgi:hypothetical protein
MDMAIRVMGRRMTRGPAYSRCCALVLLAACAGARGAASVETAPSSPALLAGGEVNVPTLAPPTPTSQLTLSAGVGETDNVYLTAPPTQSQTMGMLGLDFDLLRQGTVLDVDTKGDFEYFDYLQHAYGEELYGRFDGLASLQIVPDNFKWVAEDYFGQAQVDPFEPLTPLNVQYVNVFSTGPDFRVRLGDTGFAQMDLRYATTHYQTSPLSGDRELANLSVGDQLSPVSSVSLNVDEQRLRFDDTSVNTDYDRRESYARYQLTGARTGIELELGATQTNQTERWVSAPLAKLSLRRLVSRSLTLTLTLGHQLTDASDSFRNLKSGATGGIVISPAIGTTESYLSNYGSAELLFERDRTRFALSGRYERDTYAESTPLDLTDSAVEAFVQRLMTPIWTLQLQGSWRRFDYFNGGYAETNWPVGAALILTPGRHVDVKLSADHILHEVSGRGFDYTENRVLLVVEYRPWEQ